MAAPVTELIDERIASLRDRYEKEIKSTNHEEIREDEFGNRVVIRWKDDKSGDKIGPDVTVEFYK